MTAIDWSAMTPRAVYDALRAAPKVAGEWTLQRDGRWLRETRDDAYAAGVVEGAVSWGWHVLGLVTTGFKDTRESAMAAADEELRRRGWILVSTPTPEARDGG